MIGVYGECDDMCIWMEHSEGVTICVYRGSI